ncbi:unnamed protein product, partial [marine sediment metagenome]
PGSCSVTSRNQRERWRVNDEEEFINILLAAQKAGENVDDVLEVATQYTVRARQASKLLEAWDSSGKLDGFLSKAKKGIKNVVGKEPPKTTVSLSFLEEEKDTEEIEDIAMPVKNKESSDGLSGYDGL